MRYLSVCSGVEAASLAWEYLGWDPVAFSELEPFPCAVLAARWPNVPNLGDMTKINVKENGDIEYGTTGILANDGRTIDILVGGTPCQDTSVAGKRAGLVEGSQSRLAFTYAELAYRLAAYRGVKWVCWENVPGVWSLNGGQDFAAFLSSLAGWDVDVPRGGWKSFGIVRNATDGNFGLAYRCIDAQYARVDGFPKAIPQRRRRVFVVGHLGSWERAAEVLFESASLLVHTPPSRRKAKVAAKSVEEHSGNSSKLGFDASWEIVKNSNGDDVSSTLTSTDLVKQFTSQTYASGFVLCVHGSQAPISNTDHANTLGCNNGWENCISNGGYVRRLLPVECERLMGFPDGHTIPTFAEITDELVRQFVGIFSVWDCINAKDPTGVRRKTEKQVLTWLEKISNSETCPDSPRYKACGNSMCVNVMRWVGLGIEAIENEIKGE